MTFFVLFWFFCDCCCRDENKEKCGRDEEVIVLELRRVVDGVERVSYWLYRRVHEGWLKVWLTMVKQNKENLKKEC